LSCFWQSIRSQTERECSLFFIFPKHYRRPQLYSLKILHMSIRYWFKLKLLPLYLIASIWFLPNFSFLGWHALWRFISQDIIPAPIRLSGQSGTQLLTQTMDWFGDILREQALPGLITTVQLSFAAMVLSALLALLLFPLISKLFYPAWARVCSHSLLLIMRSIPELLLAFILLLLFGPSMLPALIALAIHNGALLAYLTGRQTEMMILRPDAPKGLNLYTYEIVPRIYSSFLSLLFYRWEVIIRESAMLGLLGVATLGFYIDSAFEGFRLDRALILIMMTALLNITVDVFSTWIRKKIKLKNN